MNNYTVKCSLPTNYEGENEGGMKGEEGRGEEGGET